VNVADGQLLHVIGWVCFLAFVALAFRVVLPLEPDPTRHR
jgi:hypothetical protein